MAAPFPMSDAEWRDDFLASAADAGERAAASKDTFVREAWERVADGYRDLAAGITLAGKA